MDMGVWAIRTERYGGFCDGFADQKMRHKSVRMVKSVIGHYRITLWFSVQIQIVLKQTPTRRLVTIVILLAIKLPIMCFKVA